jgi:hypothetical protein
VRADPFSKSQMYPVAEDLLSFWGCQVGSEAAPNSTHSEHGRLRCETNAKLLKVLTSSVLDCQQAGSGKVLGTQVRNAIH